MKRYFNNITEKQVIMLEFNANSIAKFLDPQNILGDHVEIVEINKAEYLRLKNMYQQENETNLTMTITR